MRTPGSLKKKPNEKIHYHRHAECGKTAIIRQLELDGFRVVEEAATDVIAAANAQGMVEPCVSVVTIAHSSAGRELY